MQGRPRRFDQPRAGLKEGRGEGVPGTMIRREKRGSGWKWNKGLVKKDTRTDLADKGPQDRKLKCARSRGAACELVGEQEAGTA